MRILPVIALLLQLLAPTGPTRIVDAPAIGGTCDCVTACCCGGGSASDHCAPVPAEICACDSGFQERGPEAPLPRDGKKLTPLLALGLTGIAVTLPDPSRHALRPKAEPAPTTSHNEVQALLCVWRT